MSELILHPHIIKRAQEELDAVVDADRLVGEFDLPKLRYLQAIVKETFRTHPPVPLGLPRESTHATRVLGYDIPNHSRQILNLFAIHRDPDVYENPDTFDPDRFLEKHQEVDHLSSYGSYQLMPFGVGRRMCPGYQLGDMVVHVVLGNLLHSFDWSLPKGGSMEGFDMTEVMSTVMGRKTPLHLVATPRLLLNEQFTQDKGCFTHETESPRPFHFKHSH
jgi:cytochrome P450